MMTPLQQELIDRVRTNIDHWPHKITQQELAHRAGITDKHVSRLLHGKDQGRITTWQKLLDASTPPAHDKSPDHKVIQAS